MREKNKILMFGMIYSLVFWIIAREINKNTISFENDVKTYTIGMIILCLLMYLPSIYMLAKDQCSFKEMGFVLNRRSVVIAAAFLFLNMILGQVTKAPVDILREGIARTGEELICRGFMYWVVLKLFKDKSYKNVAAIIITSVLFTTMHTQPGRTFVGIPLLIYVIVVLAITRWWSKSLLPSAVIHCTVDLNYQAGFIAMLVFFIFIYWGHRKGEKVIFLSKKDSVLSPKEVKMKKHTKTKLLILTITVVALISAVAMHYVNKFNEPTNIININWKTNLPKAEAKTEVIVDETGGFPSDGTSLIKITYDKAGFDQLLKNNDFIPADLKFYSKYGDFIKSVNKKSKINDFVDKINDNPNIIYKMVEKPKGFLILIIDTSKPNNYMLYCVECTR